MKDFLVGISAAKEIKIFMAKERIPLNLRRRVIERDGLRCVYCDEDLTDKSFSLAKIFLGEENVSELPIRMTAEDFAFISQKVPSCFFRLGTAGKNNTFTSGVHSPTFNVEESAIETGMGLLAWLAVNA